MTDLLPFAMQLAERLPGFLLDQCIAATLLILPLGLVWLFYVQKRLWIENTIWFVFLFRLLLPVAPESEFGLQALLQRYSEPSTESALLASCLENGIVAGHPSMPAAAVTEVIPAFLDKRLSLVLFFVFLCGFVTVSVLLLWRWYRYRLMLKRGSPVYQREILRQGDIWRRRFGIRRTVTLVSGNQLQIPFTMGIFKPLIFLPEALLIDPQPKILSAIIAHEMAHIRRLDALKITLAGIVQSLFWFHPLVWIGAYRLAQLREENCDRTAVNSGGISATAYGWGMLATLELQYFGEHWLAVRSAAQTTRHKMIRRLILLKKGEALMPKSRYWAIALVISIGLLVLPTAPEQAVAQGAPALEQEQIVTFVMPIKLGKITSSFGMRLHPIEKKQIQHKGVDIAADSGTPVYAAASGVVTFATFTEGYGNKVVVAHAGSYQTMYGQLEKILVKNGDKVSAGQQIATVGSTGRSTGPHLHFEVIKDDENIDPEKQVDFSSLDDC